MTAVVGCLVGVAVSVAILWIAVGRRYITKTHPSVDLGGHGYRHVSIMGNLSGFAVTGLVLLVTLSRDLPSRTGTQFTTLLTMFLVAYMGYFATSVMFANVPDAADSESGFDVAAATYVGAASTMYFTILIGWLALRPLFVTFGLSMMADLTGWLLIGAAVGGYGLFAQHLYKSGYASGRLTVFMAVVAAGVTAAYWLIAARLRLQSPQATLDLTVTAFVIGSVATGFIGALRPLSRSNLTARPLAAYGHFLMIGYAQGAVVIIGFLLLAVLGLA